MTIRLRCFPNHAAPLHSCKYRRLRAPATILFPINIDPNALAAGPRVYYVWFDFRKRACDADGDIFSLLVSRPLETVTKP